MQGGRNLLLPLIILIVQLNLVICGSELSTIVGNHANNFDSTDTSDENCIGNRLEAAEIGRQCSRKCRKDVPCENTRKQCLCDGLCGLSCLKPDLTCPTELVKIDNGDYFPNSNLFNTRVIFTCNEGYYLFGSRERSCQGDEDWSGTRAECLKEPLCRSPPKVNHARNPTSSDSFYKLNDRINYSCYPGYQSKGIPEAECRLISANQTGWVWSSNSTSLAPSPFKCVPRSCGDPGMIENARRQGESFIIASSVLYTCNDGYEMIGQARRYCQSDNQWSGQAPQCEPITCNPTDHLENGKINYVYPLVYNSTVEYSCDFGFQLIGPKQRRCGPERRLLGEVPVCEEIDCGDIGTLHNGFIKGFSNRMGDRKEFHCLDKMKFVGKSNESICLESGQWSSPVPKCLAACKVPHIDHASSVFVISESELTLLAGNETNNITLAPINVDTSVEHGSYLRVICDKSYELDEEMDTNNYIQVAPMCQNETWSYMPKCKPSECQQAPPNPKNGRIRLSSVEHKAKGFVHCLDGYKLIGDNITYCNRGNWSTINAQCQEIYCNFPGVIEHGRVLLVGLTGMYDYKPYIRRISNNRQIAYECENGYRMSDGAPSGATCMDGQWKPEGLPTCIKE